MNNGQKVLLVTGAGGFVGKHVVREAEDGAFGEICVCVPPPSWNILDVPRVVDLIRETRPSSVLHLAAQSYVPQSFDDPAGTVQTNVVGTANLLKALQDDGFAGRLLYVSSGDIYGAVSEDALPVDENTVPHPRSPYGVSKWAAEQLCLQTSRIGSLDCVVARPFNHVGPGQGDQFVLPSIARQIVEIERGKRLPVVDVGDIDSTRDFTDVRDIVAAYASILARGRRGGIYVVASGVERRIRDLLSMMLSITGLDVEIHQDANRMRPTEQKRMRADSSLLTRETGWRPKISMEKTILDILNNARDLEQ